MKRTFAALSLAFCAMGSAFAQSDSELNSRALYASVGREAGNTSFAFGFRGANNWAVEVGALTNGDYEDGEVLDYPVPHFSYTNLGKKNIGSTYGLDVVKFIPLGTVVSVGLGVGAYFVDERQVARSNVTGWLYSESKNTRVKGAGQVSLQARVGQSGVVGLGYHTIRGPQVTLGVFY